MHVVVIMRLGVEKVRDYVSPLLFSGGVETVTVVRHAQTTLTHDKLRWAIFRSGVRDGAVRVSRGAQFRNVALAFWHGWQTVRRVRPSAVVSFNLMPYGVIAWAAARLTGRQVVVALIGTDFDVWIQRSALSPILRAIVRNLDGVTVVGTMQRDALLRYGVRAERLAILPNAIDTRVFTPDPAVTPTFDLVYTGYLREPKRVDLVLYTLAAVVRQRPDTRLLIVGDGPERAALEALAQQLGIAQLVTFFGHTDAVVQQLRRGRVYISLSEREGLPMAIIEAMCVGLPVVTTDVGAMRAAVRDGENGLLVSSPADPEITAAHIVRLLDDPALYARMQAAGEAVRAHFGYDGAAQVWESVLAKLRRAGYSDAAETPAT